MYVRQGEQYVFVNRKNIFLENSWKYVIPSNDTFAKISHVDLPFLVSIQQHFRVKPQIWTQKFEKRFREIC